MNSPQPGQVWIDPAGLRAIIARTSPELVITDPETGRSTTLPPGTLEDTGWRLEQPVLDLGS